MTHPHACADCWVRAQHRALLNELRAGRALVAADSLSLCVTNMPTRMAELRGLGFPIKTEFERGTGPDGAPALIERYSMQPCTGFQSA
jgi:hypothetical protein